ncbi:endonuclease/exonuclease/phosphatase family protein [Ornithinimicrobium sp. Y1694]|uniref:endonuclease/exonuclease/phosphatase family protein n=1 Tax=Ornithinimicrobium sp. Y1694 TaxID=3418590 RepID=UPI003CEAB357
MTQRTFSLSVALSLALVGSLALTPAMASPGTSGGNGAGTGRQGPGNNAAVHHDVRFATFNVAMNRSEEGQLREELATPDSQQIRNVAETIQRTRPDVPLLNEFDYDPSGESVNLFRENYLEVGQQGADPIDYPYAYAAESNTGIPSGYDLNGDGRTNGPDDAFGYGEFPGQYGMVVYSRYPINEAEVRTFQHFRWQDMPGHVMPEDYYPAEAEPILRLSSKSHWDLPIQVGNRTVHLLAAHPTPPAFDGPEERNKRRNHDEIRFWADYVGNPRQGDYIYDDQGRTGGLAPGSRFVIAGDYNADPYDGDSYDNAIWQLLDHHRIDGSVEPRSEGGVEQAQLQGGINLEHEGDPALDTSDFSDPPGNLRVDYVLPSKNLNARDAGVFWPTSDDPLYRLTGTWPFPTSDHRLVWVDLHLPHKR